jgi:hypothetical protein
VIDNHKEASGKEPSAMHVFVAVKMIIIVHMQDADTHTHTHTDKDFRVGRYCIN